jgi:pimeloyl-ACP methyl ester carboxylesterase
MASTVSRHSERDLRRLLETQAVGARVPAGLAATLSLEAGDGLAWTIRLADERMTVERGLPEDPSVRVLAGPGTLAAVAEGRRSGIEAFLRGELAVRGNLALALRLDALLRGDRQPRRWPRVERTRAGGIDTAYLEAGSGEPIVLLHGLGATNASLLPPVWDLARDHHVIAPDLPGHGDTGKPVRAYHSRFYARWLVALLDDLGVERAHLVGNSMGGRVALEVAMRAPERVGRMVLLAPSPAFIRNREWVRLVRVLRPELALMPLPIAHRRVVRGIKLMFSRPDRVPESWYAAAADEFMRVFSTARGRIAFFSAARQIYLEEPHGEQGFWDRLPSVTAPTFFVWGGRDRLVPAKFSRHAERALPSSSSVVLEDCGHVPQYELPKRTNQLIRGFLDAE